MVTGAPARQPTPVRDACSAGVEMSAVRVAPGPETCSVTNTLTKRGADDGDAPGASAAREAVAEPE